MDDIPIRVETNSPIIFVTRLLRFTVTVSCLALFWHKPPPILAEVAAF